MAVLQLRKLDFVRDSATSPDASGSSGTKLVVRELASPSTDGGSIEAEVVGVTGLVQQMVSRFSEIPSPSKGDKPTPPSWRTNRVRQSSASQNGAVTSPTSVIRQPLSHRAGGAGGSPTRRSVQWGPTAGQSVHPTSPCSTNGHLDNARPDTTGSVSRSRTTKDQRQTSLSTSPVSPVSKLCTLNGVNSGPRHPLANGDVPCKDTLEATIGEDTTRTETTLPASQVHHLKDDYNNNDDVAVSASNSQASFVNRVTLSLSPRTPRQSQVSLSSPPCRSPSGPSLLRHPTSDGSRAPERSAGGDGSRNLSAGKPESTAIELLENGDSGKSDLLSGGLVDLNGEEPFRTTSNIAVEHDATVIGSESCVGDESNRVSSATAMQDVTDSVQKDGHYFLGLVKSEEDKINNLCLKAEADLNGPISEEASGRLRAAIGKGHLLTTKKFEQFRELCHQNLTQSSVEQFQTTVEDLAGFWDLVMIQVEDVDSMFAEIETLRKNNWKEQSPVTNGFVSSPTSKMPSSAATPLSSRHHGKSKSMHSREAGTPVSAKTEASKARAEARKRLLAAKAAGRQRKASETDSDVQIFIS